MIVVFSKFDAMAGSDIFKHVPADDLVAYESCKAILLTFKHNGEILFQAITEVLSDRVYLWEIAGHFLRRYNLLDATCTGLAKGFGLKKVSFNTKHRAVKVAAKFAGYTLDDNGEYTKEVA